jgi:glycosyltransferase involved in cell wall biosynthesis
MSKELVDSESEPPLRIGIDAHTVGQRRTGDESYTTGLIRGLSRIDQRNHYTLYTTSEAAEDLLGPLPSNFHLRRVHPHQREARIAFSLPLRLSLDRNDVVHFQYIAPPILAAPLVLSVHDISFEAFPEYFPPLERFALRRLAPLCMKRAARVLTVSEFSRQQIAEAYGLPEEKIAVIYNSVSEGFAAQPCDNGPEVRGLYGLDRDYVLWVGNFIRRKRPEVLIKAFEKLFNEGDPGCDLALVGNKSGMYPELLEAIRRAGLEKRVHFLGYVPPEHLPTLYREARVFVFPSQYEGFGIPVLEAMSCAAPVICARGSSLPEVVGDAAISLPEMTPTSLAAALRVVLHDKDRRGELVARGLGRVKRFSWDQSARETLAAYRSAAAGTRS